MMNAPSGQEHVVKKSKFTEEQIAFALKQAELGTRVEEVCRKMGISEATFYVRKKRYGGVGPSELRRLRQLEEENRKLKQIVADLSLDKAMLHAVVAKKLCGPPSDASWCPTSCNASGAASARRCASCACRHRPICTSPNARTRAC